MIGIFYVSSFLPWRRWIAYEGSPLLLPSRSVGTLDSTSYEEMPKYFVVLAIVPFVCGVSTLSKHSPSHRVFTDQSDVACTRPETP